MPISLFYHYADINDPDTLASRLRVLGSRLCLAGRIRIGGEGVNGTFGGSEKSVASFHDALLEELHVPSIDFKVAEGSAEHFPEGWRVRVCKELVTLGVDPKLASWRDAAPHIDPDQFRKEIMDDVAAPTGDVIVLDVRNHYEHAIGRFEGAVLPPIRQFSDFPKFLNDNRDVFKGKRVLMYCTGGVRCERASALLRSVGEPSSIAQLRGGIDRFLNNYPCGGGIFKGKNLVFDARQAVSTSRLTIVGKCVCCSSPWDDYSENWRCSYCRSRVIVCDQLKCAETYRSQHGSLCALCWQAGRANHGESDRRKDLRASIVGG